jgi:predicted component of type VI protein secretion system
MTPLTAHVLTRLIEDVIVNYEPRAKIIGIDVLPNLDRNEYECTISFFVVNAPTELVDLTIFLERLR